MINAKPNLNGNTPDDFVDAAESLYATASETGIVVKRALAEILHGRNYQCSVNPDAAREADLARISVIIDAIEDLKKVAIELHDIADEGTLNLMTRRIVPAS